MNDADGLPNPQRNWVMACALMGFTLTTLDGAIANIALPTLAHEFATTESATVWVVNIYQLAMAVCLLPAAAIGGIFGLKRIYAFGLALFTLASLLCALAPSLDALLAARLLQGIGGACAISLSPALVRLLYPRALAGRGYALVALVIAVSSALGPTIAALILSVAAWPWLFLVNLPICLIALPLFIAMAPQTPGRWQPFDISGAALNALALGLIVVGVGQLASGAAGLAIAAILIGLLCLLALVLQQRQRAVPLLPLDLMRIPVFALSIGTSICSYCAQILAFVSLPFLFQVVLHRSAFATGLLVTPWPLLVAVAAPVAGRLIARHPAAILGSIGLAIMTTGLVLLALLPAAPSNADIIWRMAICGLGFGFFQTPNNTTLMTAGPAARNAAASAMLGVARVTGWSLGSALVTVIFATDGAHGTVICLSVAAVVSALGVIASAARGLPWKLPSHG
ncbi:MAG TPA: MFS transporter [Roseomonas sp.]